MGYSDENFCPEAPWKQKSKQKVVRVTRIYIADVEVDVPEGFTDDEVKSLATDQLGAYPDKDWFLSDEIVVCV